MSVPGLVTAVARFLASRWPRGKRAPVPQQQLEAIKRLIPENLRWTTVEWNQWGGCTMMVHQAKELLYGNSLSAAL